MGPAMTFPLVPAPPPFPRRDAQALVELLKDRSGLTVAVEKVAAVDPRLRRLLRDRALPDLAALVDRMRARPYDPINAECVNLFTIHETLFFRDPPVFEALRDQAIPEMIRRREAERRLRIWCAAASTGQEPYSVAMLLDEHFPRLQAWDVRVIGTDLSGDAVATARRARYRSLEVNRGVPEHLLARYFRLDGEEWELHRRIADRVEFRVANLLEPMLDLPACDLILARNVLIYFEPPTKRRAFERFRRAIRSDGYLILGAAETAQSEIDAFAAERVGQAVFYRPAPGANGAAPAP